MLPIPIPSPWIVALAPVVGLAVDVAIQVVGFRTRIFPTLLGSIVAGFAIGVGVAIVLTLTASIGDHDVPSLLVLAAGNAGVTAALGYGYFHFVNLTETARRIRLLWELDEAGDAGLSRSAIQERYGASAMVDARLGRLVSKGQIRRDGDRLRIGDPTVLRMAGLIRTMKLLVLGRDREDLPGR